MQNSVYTKRNNSLTIRLLGSTIIVVQLATEEIQPVFEVQDFVIHEITRASFNQQYSFLWQVLCQSTSNDAACGTSSYDQIIEAINLRGGEFGGGHDEMRKLMVWKD